LFDTIVELNQAVRFTTSQYFYVHSLVIRFGQVYLSIRNVSYAYSIFRKIRIRQLTYSILTYAYPRAIRPGTHWRQSRIRQCSAFVALVFCRKSTVAGSSDLSNNFRTTTYMNIYEARYDLAHSDVVSTLSLVRTNWRQSRIRLWSRSNICYVGHSNPLLID